MLRGVSDQKGMTLVEVIVVSAITSLLLGVIMSALITGQNLFASGQASNNAHFGAENLLEKIALEVGKTGTEAGNEPEIYNGSDDPDTSGPAFGFYRRIVNADGEVEWSPNMYYVKCFPVGHKRFGGMAVFWEDQPPAWVGDLVPGANDVYYVIGSGVKQLSFEQAAGRLKVTVQVERAARRGRTSSSTLVTSLVIPEYSTP